ncbi:hypothetical protein D9M69_553100 [compost metagenome]
MRGEVVDQHGQQGDQRRYAQRQQRHALLVQFHQRLGCVALFGQAIEHTAVAVDATVIDRERSGEHHEIEDVRCCVAADHGEDLHERAAAIGIARSAECL